MLYLSNAPDIRLLVDRLASLLGDPLADPMIPDCVAVPTAGMQRWTKLELARTLGASHGRHDGVTANIDFVYPGHLRQAVLEADSENPSAEADPWNLERLIWAVLDVLCERGPGRDLEFMPPLANGATQYARARRIADLFDRYSLHRPELIEGWIQGRDVDASGERISPAMAWQPKLWRRVRERIGRPSPVERMPVLLRDLARGHLALELSPRISVFGLSSLPGGGVFLDLVNALSVDREVHCLLLDPALTVSRRVARAVSEIAALPSERGGGRFEFGTEGHPLLASWGRLFDERAYLLEIARRRGVIPDLSESPAKPRPMPWIDPSSLLTKVQRDIRLDRPPERDFDLAPDDRSIEIHGCHGPARQVQVLRDAILHLLNDDDTLAEEDVVVLCPQLEAFAPHIEAGFGVPAGGAHSEGETDSFAHPPATPRLSYRIVDRSLRVSSSLFEAVEALLSLASGRCSATEVLEFVALPPVRRRYRFDERDLDTIGYWIDVTGVRWGLHARHRMSHGFSEFYPKNTWQSAFDRLLMGVAVREPELAASVGDIVPVDVEGDEIDLAGRLADLVARLEGFVDMSMKRHRLHHWCDVLITIAGEMFESETGQEWEMDRLRELLVSVADRAAIDGAEVATDLSFAEFRRVVADELRWRSGRADFFRGGVTVSSMTPLRWLPFRVVCLLGLDDDITPREGTDGDDLVALAPRFGDPEPRAESRQCLLEALLAADERLIVTLNARDERTNQPVPPSVPYQELRETVLATMTAESSRDWQRDCVVDHPRQPYDERNFKRGALVGATTWSFDRISYAGAVARSESPRVVRDFLDEPLELDGCGDDWHLEVDELRRFLENPIRSFMRQRLGIASPFEDVARSDELALGVSGLEGFSIGSRLLEARLAESTPDGWAALRDEWWAREGARDTLPVGPLADAVRDEIESSVDLVVDAMRARGIEGVVPVGELLALRVGEQVESIGACTVAGPVRVGSFVRPDGFEWRGSWRVRYTRPRSSQELLAWLDLLMLTLSNPKETWHSVVIRRGSREGADDGVVDLSLAGSNAEERLESAHLGLRAILRCARLGLTEPIPLFPRLSRALHLGTARESDWIGTRALRGEGQDHDTVLSFGKIPLAELCAIPARSDDPGAGPFRALRLAHFLWGAFDASVVTLTPPGAPDQVPGNSNHDELPVLDGRST